MGTNPNRKKIKPSRFLIGLVRLISLILGKTLWRLKFHGLENLSKRPDDGLIIASNHQTYLDPFLIGAPIKLPMRFMAWDQPFKWSISSRLLRMLGAFPVSLKKRGSIHALRTAVEILENDGVLVIFPEASREFSDGKLLPFKTGAVRLALEANVPILPVTIRGANKVWSRDHKLPRLGKIEVYFHPLLYLQDEEIGGNLASRVEKSNEKLRKIIASV